jgi:hypothetical protein
MWSILRTRRTFMTSPHTAMQRGMERPDTGCRRHIHRLPRRRCLADTIPFPQQSLRLLSPYPYVESRPPAQRLLIAARPYQPRPRGSRTGEGWCFYTTHASGKPPGSTIQTAHTRKMKWPAVATSTAAAGPGHRC